MTEKGLLTKELEGLAIEALDQLISTTGLAEIGTDAAIRMFVPIIDNHIVDRIRDDVKIPVRNAASLVVAGNHEEACAQIAKAINAVVNIEGVDESLEEEIARKQLEVFLLLVKAAMQRRKS
jgi:hypothetical protein